jgi:hypothetical protein
VRLCRQVVAGLPEASGLDAARIRNRDAHWTQVELRHSEGYHANAGGCEPRCQTCGIGHGGADVRSSTEGSTHGRREACPIARISLMLDNLPIGACMRAKPHDVQRTVWLHALRYRDARRLAADFADVLCVLLGRAFFCLPPSFSRCWSPACRFRSGGGNFSVPLSGRRPFCNAIRQPFCGGHATPTAPVGGASIHQQGFARRQSRHRSRRSGHRAVSRRSLEVFKEGSAGRILKHGAPQKEELEGLLPALHFAIGHPPYVLTYCLKAP